MNTSRILVVEDENDLRRTISKLLRTNSFMVFEAKDGFAAIEVLEREQIDVILSDLRMPNKDGYELLQYVRSQKQFDKIPFIILSAKGQMADLRRGMEMGADDYVIKPVSIDTIISAIESRISRFNWRSNNKSGHAFDAKILLLIDTLTKTEKVIMAIVAEGLTNLEIADKYFLSEMTVKNHRQSIHRKLHLSGSNALLKFCKDNPRVVEIVKESIQ